MKSNTIRAVLAAALLATGLLAGATTHQKNAAPTVANAAAAVPTAVENTLRKVLPERFPALGKIDHVARTPVAGLFEIRAGNDIFYADAEGNHIIIQGELIETRTKRNLTEARIEQIFAVDFRQLPLKDAFVMVRGNGKRKIAVFEDPNCGYCKRFERDLQKVDDVTVYLFLFPILGPDSEQKSRNIWCAKDRAKAWLDWMVRNEAAPRAEESCDASALARNVELGKRHRITGTPTLIFTDNARVPGAISAAEVEKHLAAASK